MFGAHCSFGLRASRSALHDRRAHALPGVEDVILDAASRAFGAQLLHVSGASLGLCRRVGAVVEPPREHALYRVRARTASKARGVGDAFLRVRRKRGQERIGCGPLGGCCGLAELGLNAIAGRIIVRDPSGERLFGMQIVHRVLDHGRRQDARYGLEVTAGGDADQLRLGSVLLALLEVRTRSFAIELGGDADVMARSDKSQIVFGDLLAALRSLHECSTSDVRIVGAGDHALRVVLRQLQLGAGSTR